MKVFEINGDTGASKILVGEQIVRLSEYMPDHNNVVVITDTNLFRLYSNHMDKYQIIQIGTGEAIKNLETVNQIYRQMQEFGVDRSWYVLGFGGGIVCDIAGFVASTYMRGLSFGFVSTSLLSQVDASVGGKNGVNFNGYKNIIGTFNQPDFVLCDIELLNTLPDKELTNGFAEIVKHACIWDADMFVYLENNYKSALELKHEVVEYLLYRSVEIKSGIVQQDEREKGLRKLLNFGHTIGHAIEKNTSFTHGEAVSIGSVAASKISVVESGLNAGQSERISNLLRNFDLPIQCPEGITEHVQDAIIMDKKRKAKHIDFVLLTEIGKAEIKSLSIEKVKEYVATVC